MLIRTPTEIPYSAATPKKVYLNRRNLLASAALALGGAAAFKTFSASSVNVAGAKLDARQSPLSTTEKLTSFQDVTHYNNFYEFGTAKTDPAENAKTLRTAPWTVSVEGAVAKPRVFDLDTILKLAPLEERIYRHRCVEGWSMVVPWIGIPLKAVIAAANPTSKAKYAVLRLSMTRNRCRWRAPQAFHSLTPRACEWMRRHIRWLCSVPDSTARFCRIRTALRSGSLFPGSMGSRASIVKIRFVETQPPTTWNLLASNEYGFYSNVNPEVDHPRWSQATERRLGEFFKRPTQKFNGYGSQVAGLYSGMDLRKNF